MITTKDEKGLLAVVILDRSGSMEACRQQTIDAFNEYVNSLQAVQGVDTRLSLTLFDSVSVDFIYTAMKIDDVPRLGPETYIPRGGTPLFDAIGKGIAHAEEYLSEKKTLWRVALVILTDGQENASQEFTRDVIKTKLENRQKNDNWLVIYLGANQDAWKIGGTFGVPKGNTMSYDVGNVQAAMASASGSTVTYAATGSRTMAEFSDKDRAKAISNS